jgi:putative ABC transport system permease protein
LTFPGKKGIRVFRQEAAKMGRRREMGITAGIRVALRALGRRKIRSALAMLSIGIGVGAYLCSVAVGQGASSQIAEQISDLGDNMIWIEAGGRNVNGVRSGSHGTTSLTVDDARAIEGQISLVENVSPHVDTHVQVAYGNQNWYTQVRGVGPEYLTVRRWGVAHGSSFSDEDVARSAKFCLIGQTAAVYLFGEEDPVGRIVRVNKIPCRVVGVLDAKGQSPTGQDQDDVLIMPFTTVQKKIKGTYWLDDIMCSAVSPTDLVRAEGQIASLLRERHHVGRDQEDDFNLRHPVALLEVGAKSQHTMTLVLASIATVALVVAGTGIMNMMLASVTERTREIGIRVAIGARQHDILVQFLVEAVTLSLIGGAAGVIMGLAGSYCIAYFVHWRTLVRPDSIFIALGFAFTVGILFGFLPARRASRLHPVEALAK